MKNVEIFIVSLLLKLLVFTTQVKLSELHSEVNEESSSTNNKKDVKISGITETEHFENSSLFTFPENSTQPNLNQTTFLGNSINADAVFRGFYVVLTIGSIFLIYIGVKTFRLRRHRASSRYKVLATKSEDRESFFPLAAEDGEDEEIFNASTHQGYS